MTHVNPCDKADETPPPPSYDEATEPGATTVPAAAIAPGTLKYTAVATCQSCAYLLRSDGTVDRSVFGGRVATQMVPSPGTRYTGVSASRFASLLLRSDGVVIRTRGGGLVWTKGVLVPPPGTTYTSVSAGPVNSYAVRSDGAIDRINRCGKVAEEIKPVMWPEVTFTAASAGAHQSYFLRSDGGVERRRSTRDQSVVLGPDGSFPAVGLGEQWWSPWHPASAGLPGYLIRSDGTTDRVSHVDGSVEDTLRSPSPFGTKVVAASTGSWVTLLVRSDGRIDQIDYRQQSEGTITASLRANAAGVTYIAASAGPRASYLIRSDGVCDRIAKCDGLNRFAMTPQSAEAFAQHRRVAQRRQEQSSWYGAGQWAAGTSGWVGALLNSAGMVGKDLATTPAEAPTASTALLTMPAPSSAPVTNDHATAKC